jgi:hypothetical protein
MFIHRNEMWGIGIDPKPGLTNHDYMELYSQTARALKTVSPRLKVGGPTMYLNTPREPTALVPINNDYVKDFASRCKAAQLPTDFISVSACSFHAAFISCCVHFTLLFTRVS